VFLFDYSPLKSLRYPGTAVPTMRIPFWAIDLTDSALLIVGLDEPADFKLARDPLLSDIIFNYIHS
jgi:hypothetical protein